MALGGMLGSALTARLDKAHRFAPLVAIAAGLILILSYNAASALTPHLDTTSLYAGVDVLLLAVPLMLPLALLSGLFYTLAGAAIRESEASDARSAGILTLFNTAGAALGPLVAAFLLLPTIGTEMSVVLIALVYAVIGAFLLARKEGTRLPEIAALLALALSMAWFPFGSLDRALVKTAIDRWATGTTTEVAWLSEGPAETVMYLGRRELGEPHSHRMLTNGFSMSATNVNSRRYMKLYVYLPIAIHPEPRSALLVSYGVGNTAKALTDTRALEHIDVVDISANVLAAASVVYPDPEDHPLKDPRVNVHVEDGRYFMQTTAQRYDLITSEPPPPRAAGVVNLYTREYYRLIRDRLNEGGMVSYWLPIHSLTEAATLSIVRSFCDVFEDCSLWHGDRTDLMLLGSNRARERVTEGHFLAQWQDEVVGPEMKRLGFEQPGQLGALFIGGADYLEKLTADALPLVDDHPKRVMAGFDFAPASTPPFENAWGPAEAARDRFKESELIARLWPESLRKETEDFFETQALLDRLSLRPDVNLERDIESLHHTLTETELATPILWAFGSDADIGRIIETAAKPRLDDPRVILQWGARSLAARRYEEAAQHYEAAARQPDQERFATRMQVFALCMAGELDGARSVAELRYGSVGRPLPLSPFWTWMQTRYHVLPSLLAGDLGPKDTHAALLH
jgi:predicted membrane-bound spermidine synthase